MPNSIKNRTHLFLWPMARATSLAMTSTLSLRLLPLPPLPPFLLPLPTEGSIKRNIKTVHRTERSANWDDCDIPASEEDCWSCVEKKSNIV